MTRTVGTGLALLLLLLVGATGAAGGTPQDDLRWLNDRRAANGIPGDVSLDEDWSRACAAHLRYMRTTGTILHRQDPSSPAYTPAGDWAARNAILASTQTWTANRFIWEDAPLHMAQILTPQLARTGIADDGRLVCLTTLPGYTRTTPDSATVVTYPGNATRTRERAFTKEWPVTPAEVLGFPNPTGPQLYVYQWGPVTTSGLDAFGRTVGIASAALESPRGRERIGWVDRRNGRVGRYLPNASGIIVPKRPLRPDVAYTATVRFTNGVGYTWTFVTDGPPGTTRIVGVRTASRRIATRRVCVRRVDGVCVKRRVRYTHRFLVRGRLIDTATRKSIRNGLVGIAFRGAERPVLETDRWGRFAARYLVNSFKRRYAINIIISSTDAIPASYRVRFR